MDIEEEVRAMLDLLNILERQYADKSIKETLHTRVAILRRYRRALENAE